MKSKQKKFALVITLLALAALFIPGCRNESANADSETGNRNRLYADCGVIMEEPTGFVKVVMQDGNVFAFEDVDGDWLAGDLVAILFDDSGTETVRDDIIVDYKYAGWVSEEEMKTWVRI